MRASTIGYTLCIVLALAAPALGIYPVFAMQLMCFAMFACAFNLLLGFSGMLSFGHAAYFGFASYVTSWLITAHRWDTVQSIVTATVVAGLLGLVIGAIAIRRQGIYFAMITLALGQLVYFVCLQAPFTGGENGIQGVPRGSLLGLVSLRPDVHMYYFVLAIFVAVFLFIRRIVHSPYGYVLKAIRENEPRAISLGYHVERYKLLAFVLSATIAGLAGSLKAMTLGLSTLSDVNAGNSGEVILMTLLGGTGTFFGPVLGAGIVTSLQQYLSGAVGDWVTAIIGAIFVACVMLFRRGIIGEVLAWQQRRQAGRAAAEEPVGRA
ncbi:MAG: branched-chain amino acid ABC transporter permease [Burkholderiales bacterium]